MDEKQTGILNIVMFYCVPMHDDRKRYVRKHLVKMGGLTQDEATKATADFIKNNKELQRSMLHAYWQPHPEEIGLD